MIDDHTDSFSSRPRRRRLYDDYVEPSDGEADDVPVDEHDAQSSGEESFAKGPPSLEGEVLDPASRMSDVEFANSQRYATADAIIKRYSSVSVIGALIPLPILDGLVVGIGNLRMIKELTELYGLDYQHKAARDFVVSLVTGFASTNAAGLLSRGALSAIPVVGFVWNVVGSSAISCAVTFSVGKVFAYHFEMGGTLFDFKPERTRKYFEKLVLERQAQGAT